MERDTPIQMLYQTPSGEFKLSKFNSPEHFAQTMLSLYGSSADTYIFAARVELCKEAVLVYREALKLPKEM